MEREVIRTDEFRAVRLFAGPAFADLIKARFPGQKVTDELSRGALEKGGVERLLELHANVVISLFDAGFPPEAAAGHHAAFAAFTGLLHDHGLLSVAALTPSSCFRTGAFKDKKWYVSGPGGGRERCMATGRDMACWTDDEWRARVEGLVRGAAAGGADGVLFERVAFGAMGCHCARCRELFRGFAASGGRVAGSLTEAIPGGVDPESPDFRLYAEWRAGVVSRGIERWSEAAREAAPGAVVAVSVDGLAQRNAYLEAGADIEALAAVSDVVIAESNNLTRFDRRGLTYDSTTYQILCEYAGSGRVAGLPRFRGAGFDAVYPPGRFQVAIAEAVASGGLAHAQGGEFREMKTGGWTVLTDGNLGKHREAVGVYLDWVEKNAEIYEPTEPVARIGVLHPAEEMRRRWNAVAPAFFKTLQTLTELHALHRIVPENRIEEKLGGIGLLIVPPMLDFSEGLKKAILDFLDGGKALFIGAPPDWAKGKGGVSSIPESIFAEPPGRMGFLPAGVRAWFSARARELYIGGKLARGFADFFGLYEKANMNRGRYRVPKRWEELFKAVRGIEAELPEDVLVEGPPSIHAHRRGRRGVEFYHLVNHMPGVEQMSAVSIKFPAAVRAKILSPDEPKIRYVRESRLILKVHVYTVVEVKEGF